MAFTIRSVDYFYTPVHDQPGEAYKLLSTLADMGVNLLACTAIPVGPMLTQLTLFPENALKMADAARKAQINIGGPHPALLVRIDDEIGALAVIHEKLYQADVNVYASYGVSDGKGSYGYILYIRPDELPRAVSALEL